MEARNAGSLALSVLFLVMSITSVAVASAFGAAAGVCWSILLAVAANALMLAVSR